MKDLALRLRLLGDETRLRVLRLVRREELNAGEIAGVVGIAPSAVSRQIALLRDAGLVVERRAGRFAWFRAAPEIEGGVLALLGDAVDGADDPHGDLARLDDVRRARRERRFDDGDARRPFVPGRSWAAWARALTWLVPPGLRVLDLGCGDGALTCELARFAAHVEGVDRSAALVRTARATARRRGARGVTFRAADLLDLPHDPGSFDLAVLSQTLHATEPAPALAEAARVLVSGGRVLVVDLLPHTEEWVRERLGHTRLGFAPQELQELLAADFDDVRVERLPARGGDPFRVVLATGVTRAAARARRRRTA